MGKWRERRTRTVFFESSLLLSSQSRSRSRSRVTDRRSLRSHPSFSSKSSSQHDQGLIGSRSFVFGSLVLSSLSLSSFVWMFSFSALSISSLFLFLLSSSLSLSVDRSYCLLYLLRFSLSLMKSFENKRGSWAAGKNDLSRGPLPDRLASSTSPDGPFQKPLKFDMYGPREIV